MKRLMLLLIAVSVAGSAQTFGKSKMYVEQDHKLKLRKVALDVQGDAMVATLKGVEVARFPYADITALEYEKSKHRRWKTGVLLTPLALLSKGKKHWFAVVQGGEETVFQLDKSNFSKVLGAVESKAGKKVKMVASRG